MSNLPESHMDLFEDATRAYASLATLMPDGSPQVTPVWFNIEQDALLVNTARGRVKDRNLRARPYFALLIVDPKDVLRYVQIRGRISGFSEEAALEHINRLSLKYRARPWTSVGGQVRVIFTLHPEHVSSI